MMENLNEKVSKLDVWDIALIKLSVVFAVLVVLKLWVGGITLIEETNIWWFVGALVILGLRPFYKYWIKK